MARIRSIKPDFFRHEALQEIEAANPGQYIMLVFAGLWTQADRRGRFAWKPRQLKLDILPFLDFDISLTLDTLARHGFVQRYSVDGSDYGCIPTFEDHQRISGQEAQSDGKYPGPPRKQQGSTKEHPECPGNGVRSTDIGKGKGEARSRARPLPADFDLTEEREAYARVQGLNDAPSVFAHFADYHKAKGSTFKDWDAAWRTWCRREAGYIRERGAKHGASRKGAYQRVLEANGLGGAIEGTAVRIK